MPNLFDASFCAWRPRQWPAGAIRYGQELRRACGCFLDPVVFGHWHPGGDGGG